MVKLSNGLEEVGCGTFHNFSFLIYVALPYTIKVIGGKGVCNKEGTQVSRDVFALYFVEKCGDST